MSDWGRSITSTNTFLHSRLLKATWTRGHTRSRWIARHCWADRRRGETSSYSPSFQHQMALRVTTSLSLCRTLWLAIPPGTVENQTLCNYKVHSRSFSEVFLWRSIFRRRRKLRTPTWDSDVGLTRTNLPSLNSSCRGQNVSLLLQSVTKRTETVNCYALFFLFAPNIPPRFQFSYTLNLCSSLRQHAKMAIVKLVPMLESG